jgi:hypothetical protein
MKKRRKETTTKEIYSLLRKAQAPCSASGIAQDEPHGKVFFTFLGGWACDLEVEGLGACAGQLSKLRLINSDSIKKQWLGPLLLTPTVFIFTINIFLVWF